ncbi:MULTISPECIES: MerR family transcriptional regulator [unclassified Lactococcus]|uniref:MerR family transcriptional regulator n=1 Tax=unclassified Lactococcus TaxID=2643510 RepID=UPI0011CC39B8|nr:MULTISPECIES: MerR family transcriptional regulator [unclassified Lactococcus]MQW22714.1 MerR family transcriptional regulator [Lactococcus sp. dk101]TXK44721.1 MerR family transcriptional regulator [Lactococcus sp. dk310]TXK50615.1 MerR family transcriptional regulator [Lactococcus sp. dk322]
MKINELTKLTGLTSKTLRHWEKMGLLSSKRDINGYRIYDELDLNKIFYINNLRKLNLPISEIDGLLNEKMDEKMMLENHLSRLIRTQNELSQLINQLENKLEEGDYFMNNNDFELLKKQEIAENEAKYGKEIRQKYGTTVIDDSNKKYQEQGQNEHDWAKETHSKVVKMLEDAYNTQDNFLAFEAIKLHRTWLQHFWSQEVTPQAHLTLIKMYGEDGRFRQNYTAHFDTLPEYFYEQASMYYM